MERLNLLPHLPQWGKRTVAARRRKNGFVTTVGRRAPSPPQNRQQASAATNRSESSYSPDDCRIECAVTNSSGGWNLIEERVAYSNGNSTMFRYYWGKDLSGTLQGAGGVGGLLYLTITTSNIEHQTSNCELYIPCYDNNGNVTRYIDANGATVAQYTYDAWGNVLDKSGPMCDVFRHRFSTKYFDIETGLYYYGYRFYCPWLMRWINRDPIGEVGGMNLYCFCGNNAIGYFDVNGLEWEIKRTGRRFAKATPLSDSDTFESLAAKIRLDVSDYKKWANTKDENPVRCKTYSIPNLIIYDHGKRKACGSAAVDRWGYNRMHGIVRMNDWECNVARAGYFVGYEGEVNLLNELFEWTITRGTNYGERH